VKWGTSDEIKIRLRLFRKFEKVHDFRGLMANRLLDGLVLVLAMCDYGNISGQQG